EHALSHERLPGFVQSWSSSLRLDFNTARLGRFALAHAHAQEPLAVARVHPARIRILRQVDDAPEGTGEAFLRIDADAIVAFRDVVHALPRKEKQSLVDRELYRLGIDAGSKCDDFDGIGGAAYVDCRKFTARHGAD